MCCLGQGLGGRMVWSTSIRDQWRSSSPCKAERSRLQPKPMDGWSHGGRASASPRGRGRGRGRSVGPFGRKRSTGRNSPPQMATVPSTPPSRHQRQQTLASALALDLVVGFPTTGLFRQLKSRMGLDVNAFAKDHLPSSSHTEDHHPLVWFALLRVEVDDLETIGLVQRLLECCFAQRPMHHGLHGDADTNNKTLHGQSHVHPRRLQQQQQQPQQQQQQQQQQEEEEEQEHPLDDLTVHGTIGFHQPTSNLALYLTETSENQLYRFTQKLHLRLQSFGLKSTNVLNPSRLCLVLKRLTAMPMDQFPGQLQQFHGRLRQLGVQSLTANKAGLRWTQCSLSQLAAKGSPMTAGTTSLTAEGILSIFRWASPPKTTQDQVAWTDQRPANGQKQLQTSQTLPASKNLQFQVDGQLLEHFLYDLLIVRQRTKVVVILRGLPGSGKSSVSRAIRDFCENNAELKCTICSADAYFETPRGYYHDVSQISQAHGSCRSKFRRALHPMNGSQVIVLDNTNTQRWEYDEYVQEAVEYGYDVEIVELTYRDAFQALEQSRRNAHGVSRRVIYNMLARFEADPRGHLCTAIGTALKGGLGNCVNHATCFSSLTAIQKPMKDLQDRVKFSGVFLSPSSRKELLARLPPMYSQVFADHVTLCYRPQLEDLELLPMGQRVTMEVRFMVHDDFGQCVVVNFMTDQRVTSNNRTPHVTLSVADGMQARYSNELLAKDATEVYCEPIQPPLILEGYVGVQVLLNDTTFVIERSLCERVCCASAAHEHQQQVCHVDFYYFTQTELELLATRWNGALAWQMMQMASNCSTRRWVVVETTNSESTVVINQLLDRVLTIYPITFDGVLIGTYTSIIREMRARLSIANRQPRLVTLSAAVPDELRALSDHCNAYHVATMDSVWKPMMSRYCPPQRVSLRTTLSLVGLGSQESSRCVIDEGIAMMHQVCTDVIPCFRTSGYVTRTDSIATDALDMSKLTGSDCIELAVVCNGDPITRSQTAEIISRLRTEFGVVHAICDATPNLFFSLCSASNLSLVFRVVFVEQSQETRVNSADPEAFECNICHLVASLRARYALQENHLHTVHQLNLLALLLRISMGWSSRSLLSGMDQRLYRLLMLWSEVLVLEFLENHRAVGRTAQFQDGQRADQIAQENEAGDANKSAPSDSSFNALLNKWIDLVRELGDWSPSEWHAHCEGFVSKHSAVSTGLNRFLFENLSRALNHTSDLIDAIQETDLTGRTFNHWDLLEQLLVADQRALGDKEKHRQLQHAFCLIFDLDHTRGVHGTSSRRLLPHLVRATLERLVHLQQKSASIIMNHNGWHRGWLHLQANSKETLLIILKQLQTELTTWGSASQWPGIQVRDAHSDEVVYEIQLESPNKSISRNHL